MEQEQQLKVSGGGAGGHLEVPAHPVPSSGVPVTVGGGGAAGFPGGQGGLNPFMRGKNGSDSVFGAASPLTAVGGGGGVRGVSGTPIAGHSGGSGGGGYRGGAGGAGTSGQGNAGGSATIGKTGGGGGAGAVGQSLTAPWTLLTRWNRWKWSSIFYFRLKCYKSRWWWRWLATRTARFSVDSRSAGSGGGGKSDRYAIDATPDVPSARAESAGTNLGGGGGSGAQDAGGSVRGGAGGSGVVIVNEPAIDKKIASGIWDMNAVYDNRKAGTWV